MSQTKRFDIGIRTGARARRLRAARRAAIAALIAGALGVGNVGAGQSMKTSLSTEDGVHLSASVDTKKLDPLPRIKAKVTVDVNLPIERLPDGGNAACPLLGLAPATPLSQVCVRVVTHAVVGSRQLYREHNVLVTIGDVDQGTGQPIDVTGDGANDARITIAVPPRLVPPGVDTDKPGLRVVRLAGAPATLPLKIEAVVAQGTRQRSFGYDSRQSTLPQSFTARVDLSNRDGIEGTDQVQAALSIAAGASENVALVTERFVPGLDLRETARTLREIALLGYRADPDEQTTVPTTAGIDVTLAESSRHVVLTRTEPTTLDFLISQPDHGGIAPCVGCDPATKTFQGTASVLPSSADVTLTEGQDDQTSVDYFASADVPRFDLSYDHYAGETPDLHRQTIAARIDEVPTEAHVVYAPEPGSLSLRTPGARVPLVVISGTDEEPFFDRAKTFGLRLDDLPPRLDAVYGSGRINVDARGDAIGRVEFRGQDVAGDIVVPSCKITPAPGEPCDDSYGVLRDPDASGVLIDDLTTHYLLFARVHKLKSADLRTTPDLEVVVDTAPDLGPPGSGCGFEPPPGCDARSETYRRFLAGVHTPWEDDASKIQDLAGSISQLFPQTALSFVKVGDETASDASDDVGTVTYSDASIGGRPTVRIDGTDIDGLPTGSKGATADELHIRMESVPGSMVFRFDGLGGLHFDAEGGLGLLDVLLTSGSNEDLEGPWDGLMIRDFADRYVISARITGLNGFDYSKFRVDTGEVIDGSPLFRIGHDMTLESNGAKVFRADLQKQDSEKEQGFEYQDAVITDGLPSSVHLVISKLATVFVDPELGLAHENTRWTEVAYDGGETRERLDYLSNAGKDRTLMHARVEPLPQSLDLCVAPDSKDCHPWLETAPDGSYFLDMSEPVRVQMFDCKKATINECSPTMVRTSHIIRNGFGACRRIDGDPLDPPVDDIPDWSCARKFANELTNSENFVFVDLDLQRLALAVKKTDTGFDYAVDTDGLGVVGTVYIHKDDGFDKWVWFPDDSKEDFWAEDRIGNVDCGLQWGDLCDGDSNGAHTAHCPPGVDIWLDTESFVLGVANFAEEVCPG